MYQIQRHQSGPVLTIPAFSEPGFFFNEIAQLRQQDSGTFHLLTALNQHTRQADARCALFIDDDLARSPKMAPFGSIEFVKALPDQTLVEFIDALEQQVGLLGLPALRITNYPNCYAPQQAARLVGELRRRGYRLVDQLVNCHIDVSETPLAGRMHHSEQRRLAKCERQGFSVAHWAEPDIDQVVKFIKRSREQQDYALTIETDRLAMLLQLFPRQYPVLVVRSHETIAALTVAVRVRQDILYNFLPADDAAFRTLSPAVMLTQGLYSYCQQEKITLLDLGVSVDEYRQPKPGLLRFKRNLGAEESLKLVWEKAF